MSRSMFTLTRLLPRILPSSARCYSSLRSGGRARGPRGVRGGPHHEPVGIPDNATAASRKLVERIRAREAQFQQDSQNWDYQRNENSLLSPVFIPEDPGAVIKERHPAARILDNSGLVIERKLELGTIILGYEQANKYAIMDPAGNVVGFIAEEENRFTQLLMRQFARTHRPFTTHIFDAYGNEVLRFYRPFAWINSCITAYDPIAPDTLYSGSPELVPLEQQRIIGQCMQRWHLLRRKYDLFLYRNDVGEPSMARDAASASETGIYDQFAYIDEPFLAWDFTLLSEDDPPRIIGSVNRNFAGFGREIFTDTGVYALRMDSASVAAEPSHWISGSAQGKGYRTPDLSNKGHIGGVGQISGGGRGMTLDERAVMLATAVSIDFDYFSRHSGHGGFMPVGVFGGGYSE